MAAAAVARGSCREQGRWCWVVAFAAFWVNFCLLGVHRSSAVVFVALMDAYHVSREVAAWPSGIFGFCMCITGIVAGYLSHHVSIRSIMIAGSLLASLSVSLCCASSSISHITLLYGAFQGAGIGVIVPLTHVMLNRYFQCYRAVGMGIAYAGSSAGSFLFPPLAHWMLGEFGLSGTFLLLGGIMSQSLIGVTLMRSPESGSSSKGGGDPGGTRGNQQETTPESLDVSNGSSAVALVRNDEEKNPTSERTHKVFNKKTELKFRESCSITVDVLTNFEFLMISAVFAVYFSVSAIFLMVILDFSLEKHMLKEQGIFLVTAFSFGDLAGRLLCGWIGDLWCIRRSTTVGCYLLGMAIFLMSIPLCDTCEILSAVSVLLGLLNGGVIVNYSALLTELMGLSRLPIAIAFSSSFIGITAFMRPLVIGYFRDRNDSYNFLFVSLGGAQMFLTTAWMLSTVLKGKRNKVVFSG